VNDGPRRLQIPRSLVQPLLVGGAERTPTAAVCGIGAAFVVLGYTQPSLVGFGFGLLVLVLGMWALPGVRQG
jgi:type IV secretory pathway TrbD component